MNIFSHIKKNIAILDVVNSYATMKKAGHYWKGHCPFHSEKTASFTVSPGKEIFYCFGCHANGDVVSFICQIEHCSPLEAVKLLADRYNIELPEQLSYESDLQEKKHYFDLCHAVATWCHKKLLKTTAPLSYLYGRNVTKESIIRFKLGYFPGGLSAINMFVKDMAAQNILVDDLLQAHILSQAKNVLYSPFEQRIIFPITDHLGRFCGFGGRVFKKNDERPKYYNSRENEFFSKGSLLFGLDLAKITIQKSDSVFLVEGYTDCIAMVQAGYKNTIATLGTACTTEHLKKISRFASHLYTLYDSDTAGTHAILRLAELCWQVNLELYVITLPDQEDPASFLVKHGTLKPLIKSLQDIFEFYIRQTADNFHNQSLSKKLSVSRKIITLIDTIQDPLKRDILLQKASEKLQISLETITNELKKFPDSSSFELEKTELPPKNLPLEKMPKLEKKLFFAILNNVQLLNKENKEILITCLPPTLGDVLQALYQAKKSNATISFADFFAQLSPKKQQMVSRLVLEDPTEGQPVDIENLLDQLQKKHWKNEVKRIKQNLEYAKSKNDYEKIQELIKEFTQIQNKLVQKNRYKTRDKA